MQKSKLQLLLSSPLVEEEQLVKSLMVFLSEYEIKNEQLARDLLKLFGGY